MSALALMSGAFHVPSPFFPMSLRIEELGPDEAKRIAEAFESAPLGEVLRWAWERFGRQAAIGTSFQGAGLVMIDHARKAGLDFPIFTLDTGLLFPETYELKGKLEALWGIDIESVKSDVSLEQQSLENGPELWKKYPDTCCTIRKVAPLQRKLAELSVWITGVRKQQSDTREKTRILELYRFDDLRDLYIAKMNPMANWSRDAVWDYIKANGIPYNPLHDRGYRSIGCWPCTRLSSDGENERAGRWTGFDKTECGIHTFLGESI
jgi:phosphoadenosine phosphosulfate reductase